ncbi:MAG: heme-binding domain-containing protein [Chloroflexi bacterium]|nr:heme-binding domain-containing protein [Chloroflexota bacterium]
MSLAGIAVLGTVFLAIQLVPYGRPGPNPPVRVEPRWDSPTTRQLAARACFDCHSNETTYPWYSYVAPVSWLVARDVTEGRAKLNFSEWDLPQREAGEAAKELQKGKMPMPIYLPTHPEAGLADDEKRALIRGLQATVSADRPRRR